MSVITDALKGITNLFHMEHRLIAKGLSMNLEAMMMIEGNDEAVRQAAATLEGDSYD